MFPNLRAEMARKGITTKDLSSCLGCSPKTVLNKFSGKSEFTRVELFKIKNEFFPDLTIEYLFQKQNNKQNSA